MSRLSLLHLRVVAIDDGAFDLLDQVGDGDAARAGIGAVEDGAAAPDAVALSQDGEAFRAALVAAIEDETVRVDDGGRANPVGIAPDRRTGAGTRSAQDAFRPLVVAGALFRTLQALRAWLRIVGNQIGLDGFVLVKKRFHIDHQVSNDWIAQHRLNRHPVADIAYQHFAGQAIAPVDTHGIRPADAVRARTTIGERPVHVPLDIIQSIQQAVDGVHLDPKLIPIRLTTLVGIEAFDAHQYIHEKTPLLYTL